MLPHYHILTDVVFCNNYSKNMKGKHVHFIGIGGIGMSGLARLFAHEGATVTGSDAHETDITKALETEGISVTYAQTAENITSSIDLVVYTEAMPVDHEELVAARERGIRTVNYFTALGEIANEYYLIAVSGTHGKTTTTAMLIDILEEGGLDPTAIVGSLRSKTGSNYRAGKSKYFIAEACEYRRDFRHLKPDVLIITNLEHEHVDYYENLAAVQAAFRELTQSLPADGFLICDTSDKNITPVLEGVKAKVIDYRAYIDPLMQLHLPGVHNRLNAAAAMAAAGTLGLEREVARTALEHFAGTWRRFEFKGEVNGAKVYDDYAHHPTEIKAAIAGARELYPSRKLTVVFQPHTYSRTTSLFNDFVEALSLADQVVLVPIYAAREANESGVASEQLVEELNAKNIPARFFHTLEAAALAVKEEMSNTGVVLVMGAGTITNVATSLTA